MWVKRERWREGGRGERRKVWRDLEEPEDSPLGCHERAAMRTPVRQRKKRAVHLSQSWRWRSADAQLLIQVRDTNSGPDCSARAVNHWAISSTLSRLKSVSSFSNWTQRLALIKSHRAGHTFNNPSTQKEEEGTRSSRPAWSTNWVQESQGSVILRETLSWKTNKQTKKAK